MLCDEFIADKGMAGMYPGVSRIQAKVQDAEKFILAPDFALAADGLVENYTELGRIAPFCRIPYPLCWFEVCQMDRKHWVESPIHFPTHQGAPVRIGFLTEAIASDLTSWRTILCWSLRDFRAFPLNISPLAVTYDITKNIKKDLADIIGFEWAEFDHPMIYSQDQELAHQLIRSDWSGEIRYLLAVLGLLNARNVADTEKVEYIKLNKQRIKRDKPPLSTHTLLKIRTTHKVPPANSETGGSREMRAHFVRGHFKVRRTGMFWWGPFMRGKLEKGFVNKKYEVQT